MDVIPAAVVPATTLFQATIASPRLRVCHVMSADLWAGAEVQLATLASYLRERSDISVSAVLMNEGRLAAELRALDVPVAVVDEGRHTALTILRFLTRFLREHPVDIVHTHRYKDTVLGVIAAKLSGTPHVIRTVHGLAEPMRGLELAKFRVYQALDKAALAWAADRVVAVSGGMAETLAQSGYRRSSVVRIHNGIDIEKVRAMRSRADVRRELGIAPDTLLVGTVGRLAPVKAHSSFLHAARLVTDARPGAKFAIVGDGPLRGDLETAAANLGLTSGCLFLGPREDVYDLISAMDVFVLCSLHEGIPMALLEAMALARPIVATEVGGIPEVVTHEVNGLLVPPGNERALADACVELASDPVRAETLGARARHIVEERFSKDTNGASICRQYRAVTADDRTERGEPIRTGDLSVASLAWALFRGPVRYAARRVRAAAESARERRRMEVIRRHPARLTAALRTAKQILIVCQGNIIRSPFAATMVARSLEHSPAVRIMSGGLSANPGNGAHPTALRIATERSINLTGHSSSELTPHLIATSDVIFVMEISQLLAVRERFPDAHSKTFLLTSLAPDTPLEIRDPFDQDDSRFNLCFDHITRAVTPILEILRGTIPS